MIKASKLLGMSDRELILQLEKASTTLTKLKNLNVSLRLRIKELEVARNQAAAAPEADKQTLGAGSISEIQSLREQLATAQKAAIDNLTYAQEVKQLYEDLKSSLEPPTL